MARIPTIPRLEPRRAGLAIAAAIVLATLFGVAAGALRIHENDYLALGMMRLVVATLYSQVQAAILWVALPISLLAVLLALPFPGRAAAPSAASREPLGRRGRALGATAVAVLVSVLGLGVALAVDRAIESRDARPNVIWLVVDSLRADHLGRYGYTRDTSPFIDEWSKSGALFRRPYSQESYTMASVASYFTSTYPWENRVLYDAPSIDVLDSSFVTLAEVLKEHSYRTAAFVFNPHLKAKFNFGQGFDLYDDRRPILQGLLPMPKRYETASRIYAKTAHLLSDHGDEPLFLYVHFRDVHTPYVPVAPFDEMFLDPGANERERQIALYDGEIRYTDGWIERLLALLAEHGIDSSNSLVILTADHGEEFHDEHPGDPGGWFHSRTLYEEQIRVPLIMTFPRGAFAGKVVDQPVGLIDIVPTVLDVAGIDAAKFAQFRGQSLLPLLRGEAPHGRVVRSGGNHGRLGLMSSSWKYYRYHGPTKRGETHTMTRPSGPPAQSFGEELYDLHSDPLETRNVIATQPQIASALRDHGEQPRDLGWDEALHSAKIDKETEAELRALGYLE